MTRKCIEIGRRWGLKQITGETTADNLAMIRIFRKLEFSFDPSVEPQIVLARLALEQP
jgi:hypothetical protein